MNNIKKQLIETIPKIFDMPCSCVNCGGSAGSTFSIDFGEKYMLPHSAISRIPEPICIGEAKILVWCPWRLDSTNKVIVSNECRQSSIVKGLKQLQNQKVVDIQLQEPAVDVEILFGNDMKIKVFCNFLSGYSEMGDNWYFRYHNEMYAVGWKGKVKFEKASYEFFPE